MPDATLKPGWTQVRFGDVVRLNTDRVADPLAAGIERYVGLEHIEPDDLRIRRWGLVADGTTFTNRFRPGQVLFGKRRAYQRKVAVADFEGVCSGDIYVFEPCNDWLLPELLPFLCQTDAFFDHAIGTSAGSLSPRTNWRQLAEYELALPPVEEQAVLARHFLAADVQVHAFSEAIEGAGACRSSLALSAFTRYASEPTCELRSCVISSAYGPRFPADRYSDSGNARTIRTTDFAPHLSIDYAHVPHATLDHRIVTNHRLEDGDFLLSRSGEYAGMVRVYRAREAPDFEYIPAAFIIRFRLERSKLHPDFLLEYCDGPVGRASIAAMAQGSAQPNISGTTFMTLAIPLVSLGEQQEFISRMEALRRAERTLDERRRLAICLRRRLLGQHLGGSRDGM